MEELFRSGTLEMSSSPLASLAAGPAWSDLLTNRILAVLAIALLVLSLPDIFRLTPYLVYAYGRARGAAELEHSLGIARSRTATTLLLILPFCLIADRYALIRPNFFSGIPALWLSVATVGLFISYLLLRELCYLLLHPRKLNAEQTHVLKRNPYNYFIPMTALMLLSGVFFALTRCPDDTARSILRWEIAAVSVFCLLRSGQFLSGHCSGFATFLYLCGLEIVPASALVAVVLFF
ncbi:MAG: hypothetical protein IJV37_00135 [Bacteroidales bacterium]|nr:hypothetical protein [Bacteroidales bacterium]